MFKNEKAREQEKIDKLKKFLIDADLAQEEEFDEDGSRYFKVIAFNLVASVYECEMSPSVFIYNVEGEIKLVSEIYDI